MPRVLAVIPARGGSKGFPGKNVVELAGLPLIGHSIAAARLMPWLTRCVVSTDDVAIAEVARRLDGDVPFLRPAELAADDTPMAPVLTHALATVEAAGDSAYDYLLLLDPTSPVRDPDQIRDALDLLVRHPDWDGVVSVSAPDFHPLFVGVAPSSDGTLRRYFDDGAGTTGRQQLDRFLRINGAFYLWRAEYVRTMDSAWFDGGRHGMVETREVTAVAIDYPEQLPTLAAKIAQGIVSLPWLADTRRDS